jgi:hypothetical protein
LRSKKRSYCVTEQEIKLASEQLGFIKEAKLKLNDIQMKSNAQKLLQNFADSSYISIAFEFELN